MKRKLNHIIQPKRLCVLENIHSGRRLVSGSITNFCKDARLEKNARYHITPVLNGERAHHKNWYRPDFLRQGITLKDKYNNVYPRFTVKQLLKRKILSQMGLRTLITREKKSINGLALASTEFEKVGPRNWKVERFSVIKKNKVYHGNSINGLAEKLGQYPYSFYSLAYGFVDEFKGFRLHDIKVKKKSILEV